MNSWMQSHRSITFTDPYTPDNVPPGDCGDRALSDVIDAHKVTAIIHLPLNCGA
jgi:hypothetical protein